MGVRPARKVRKVAILLDLATQATRRVVGGIVNFAATRGNWEISTLLPIGLPVIDDQPPLAFEGVISSYATAQWKDHPHVVYVSTPAEICDGPTVCPDNSEIGWLAARHMLSLGLPHYAYVGIKGNPWSRDRGASYCRELSGAGHKCRAFYYENLDWVRGFRFDPLLSDWLLALPRPCSVFCADDIVASHVSNTAQQVGLLIPEQLAVLGVNDDDLCCSAVYPALSSIGVQGAEIGYEAAQALDLLMSGAFVPNKVLRYVRPSGVVVRGSTEIMGYSDQLVCEALRLIRGRAMSEPITVQQVSDELRISRQHLLRLFASVVGRSPKDEIDLVRTERLRDLLLNSTFPIKQISHEMGFLDPAELSRFCRRTLGKSPREVRQDRPLPV